MHSGVGQNDRFADEGATFLQDLGAIAEGRSRGHDVVDEYQPGARHEMRRDAHEAPRRRQARAAGAAVLSAAGAPAERDDDRYLKARPKALREEHALVESPGSPPWRRGRHRNEDRAGREAGADPVCEQVGQHVTRIATPSLVGEDRAPQRTGIPAGRPNAQ